MQIYRNLTGESSVTEYEPGDDYILVKFRGTATYEYNYLKAGMENVEKMKQLAESGKGLGTFINRNVRNLYSRKF